MLNWFAANPRLSQLFSIASTVSTSKDRRIVEKAITAKYLWKSSKNSMSLMRNLNISSSISMLDLLAQSSLVTSITILITIIKVASNDQEGMRLRSTVLIFKFIYLILIIFPEFHLPIFLITLVSSFCLLFCGNLYKIDFFCICWWQFCVLKFVFNCQCDCFKIEISFIIYIYDMIWKYRFIRASKFTFNKIQFEFVC